MAYVVESTRATGDLITAVIWNQAVKDNPAAAWAKFDAASGHTHTGATDNAPQIPTAGITNLAVTPPKIGAQPMARAFHNAAQSVANNTVSTLAFNSERYDTDTIHDNSTNSERLTCKTAGKYGIWVNIRWASNATGVRDLSLVLSAGPTTIANVNQDSNDTGVHSMSLYTEYVMAVNEYVTVAVFQDSGGALNVDSASAFTPEFGMHWLGP